MEEVGTEELISVAKEAGSWAVVWDLERTVEGEAVVVAAAAEGMAEEEAVAVEEEAAVAVKRLVLDLHFPEIQRRELKGSRKPPKQQRRMSITANPYNKNPDFRQN